jgi:hypothetical protein
MSADNPENVEFVNQEITSPSGPELKRPRVDEEAENPTTATTPIAEEDGDIGESPETTNPPDEEAPEGEIAIEESDETEESITPENTTESQCQSQSDSCAANLPPLEEVNEGEAQDLEEDE